MAARDWKTQILATWVGNGQLDSVADHQEQLMRGHGGVTAHPLRQLNGDLLFLGENNRWFWCSVAIALTGELLVCASSGGTSSKDNWSPKSPESADAKEVLRLLRNSLCHPAHVLADRGPPPRPQLANFLIAKNIEDDRSRAGRLERTATELGQRWVAEMALRCLNLVGEAFLASNRSMPSVRQQ